MSHEKYFDFEKQIYKVISDHIIKIDDYNDKKFHILIYDYDKNENVLIAVTGFLLVNHGQKIFQELECIYNIKSNLNVQFVMKHLMKYFFTYMLCV